MRRTVRVGRDQIEYELIQTARKSIELRVASDGIKVFAPRGVRLGAADAFVRDRADWLADSLKQLEACKQAHDEAHPMVDGARVLVEGQPLLLCVECNAARRVLIDEGKLCVQWPDTAPEAVRAALRSFLIDRARGTIDRRLAHYVPLIGRTPGRIAIREQRTRWGSCSSQFNLNFNWKLIMAPPEALDYVVVHELCHLYEFNHSARFWARVEHFCAEYATWKQWLKQNGAYLGV